MPSPIQPAGAENATPRRMQLLRSCEVCRATKAKCVPSEDPNEKTCQRCAKYGKECIYIEAQPRPKRGRQARTRVAEVEKKLDGIYALLSSQNQPPGQASTGSGSTNDDTPESSPSGFTSNFSYQQIPQPSTIRVDCGQPDTCPKIPDIIDKGILTEQEVEQLLQVFTRESVSFPFVHLPKDATLQDLRDDHPFLLTAAMAYVTQRSPVLQATIEEHLRTTLATSVIIEGNTGLDLLQGLVVYLAWYHHHFKPNRAQMYQLSQLACAMAVDLGLGNKPKDQDTNLSVDAFACPPDETGENLSSPTLERMRTYVGCYTITSSIAMAFRKPNFMRHTDYIDECCQALAKAREYSTDEQLIHYSRMLSLTEQVGNVFGYGIAGEAVKLSAERVQLTVKSFLAQLEGLRRNFPSNFTEYPSLTLAYHCTHTYIHEVVLHLDSSTTSTGPQQSHSSTSTSSILTNLLLGALESIKALLEYNLALPLSATERATICDSSRLVYAIIFLGKLTLSSGIPSHLPESSTSQTNTSVPSSASTLPIIRENTNLIYYTDALAKRMGIVMSFQDQSSPTKKSVFWYFYQVFEKTKLWYQLQLTRVARFNSGTGSNGQGANGQRTDQRTMDALHVMEPEDTGKCIEHAGYVDAVTISDMEGLRSMKERLDEQRLSGKGVINLSQLSTGTSSQSNGGFNNTTIVQDLRNMNMNSQLNNPPDGIHVSGFDTAGGDGMNQNQDQMQDFQPSMLDANGNNLLDFDIEMSDDMFWEGIMAGWPTGLDHSSGGGAMMF